MTLKYIHHKIVVFHQWSRRAFAVFASIGKQINIGSLIFDIHQTVFSIFYNAYQDVFKKDKTNFLSYEEIIVQSIQLEVYKNNRYRIHY